MMDEIIDAEMKQVFFKTIQENPNTTTYDVKYYRLQLNINPAQRFIRGVVTIYFVPNIDLTEIVFDLSNELTVDSLVSNNSGIYSHIGNVIKLNHSFSAGVLDSLSIFYQGIPPQGSGSFVQSTHGNQPIIWTLSEPYGAMEWWPCKQSLTDKADSLDLIITVPEGNRVAGNGILTSTEVANGFATVTWKSRYPIVPYLVAFAVTPYAEISFLSNLQEGDLNVQNYVYKEDSSAVINELLATDTLLRLFDSIVGPYPFMNEKYGHAQFGRGGGMEHQTMSFMNHFRFELNAHELAHQWFGDKITCGSWQDLWLNEGFATYFTGIAYENLRSDSLWQGWKRSVLDKIVSEPGGSVFVLDTLNVPRLFDSRLTYRKGAYVLHMLRHQIGDDAFFSGIQSYIQDPNLAYKTALTDDFFNHMSQNAGWDLSYYKSEWIYGEGYPSFNVQWDQVNNDVDIILSQTTSHLSVDFFHLFVPILFTNSSGDSLIQTVWHASNSQEHRIPVGFKVEQVIIDPNLDLISKGNFSLNTDLITGFSLYPNPTSSIFTVKPGNDFGRLESYTIYSLDGKVVRNELNFDPYQNSKIDVSKLPSGIYIISFKSSSQEIIQKFVVNH